MTFRSSPSPDGTAVKPPRCLSDVSRSTERPPAMPDPLSELRVRLWDAINNYATTCGGDPSAHVYGNTSRQKAVAEVERALRQAYEAGERAGHDYGYYAGYEAGREDVRNGY